MISVTLAQGAGAGAPLPGPASASGAPAAGDARGAALLGLPGSQPLQPAPADEKPPLESLLKPRSIAKVTEDLDIVTNSEWEDDDFRFVNAALVRTPVSFTRPRVTEWSIYPKLSPAIKKFEYDPGSSTIELIGEAYGLHMHSWVKVVRVYSDLVRFAIVRGDMTGFKVNAFLFEHHGKTLTVAKGDYPGAKQMLPSLVALLFKPASEVVLSVATKNFRSYIEEEYNKLRK